MLRNAAFWKPEIVSEYREHSDWTDQSYVTSNMTKSGRSRLHSRPRQTRTSKSSGALNLSITTPGQHQQNNNRATVANQNGMVTGRVVQSETLLLIPMQGLEFPSYVLAALTAAGGAIGYARTKSKPSLIAGTAVGLLCRLLSFFFLAALWCWRLRADRGLPWALTCRVDGLGGYRIANNEPYGVELSLLASLVLGGSAFPRAIRLRKPVPIMLSLFAAYGLVTFGDAFRRSF